jgi:hypothetical protein
LSRGSVVHGRRNSLRGATLAGGHVYLRIFWIAILLAVILNIVLAVRASHSETMGEYWTRTWAQRYGLSSDYMWSIALCESGGNPFIRGPALGDGMGPPIGLFQIKSSTYAMLRAALNNDPTLAPNLTWFDPEWGWIEDNDGASSAHVAAWAWAHNYSYLWECQ